MAFNWKDEWAIGNEKIDSQHKELIKTINTLHQACRSGEGFNVIDETMKFLLDYTVNHFNDEETLQRSVGFPDYRNHKEIHEAFKAQAVGFYEKLKSGTSKNVFLIQMSTAIAEWVVNHVTKEDKKIGEYLKAKSEQSGIPRV